MECQEKKGRTRIGRSQLTGEDGSLPQRDLPEKKKSNL